MQPARISLEDKHSELIGRLVRSGRFRSASDVVARSLELLEEREAQAHLFLADPERQAEQGLASGPATPMETAGELVLAFRRQR